MAAALRFLLAANLLAALSSAAFDYPSAGLGSRWVLDSSRSNNSVGFFDGSQVQALLLRGSGGPRFASGFYCLASACARDRYYFGVFLVVTDSGGGIAMPAIAFPQPVWSANRDCPVARGASLELGLDGNLVLRDADGSLAWESGTRNAGVSSLTLQESGNLVLERSKSGSGVWESFDHPTDALVPGQILKPGTRLVASSSPTNQSAGEIFLAMADDGLGLYAAADPPQRYWAKIASESPAIARYGDGFLGLFSSEDGSSVPDASIKLPEPQYPTGQYLKLAPDGRLLLYSWDDDRGWIESLDLLRESDGPFSLCALPSACGRFGVCTGERDCSCPSSFRPVDPLRPSAGCLDPAAPYDCRSREFVELPGIDYFANDFGGGIWNKSSAECKRLCSDCSCRAAFYRNRANAPDPSVGGVCYTVAEVFTLRNSYRGPGYTSVAWIKV